MNTISTAFKQINFSLGNGNPVQVTPQAPASLDLVTLSGAQGNSALKERAGKALFLGGAIGIPSCLGAAFGLPGVIAGCAVDTLAAMHLAKTMDPGAKKAAVTAAVVASAVAGGIGAVFGFQGAGMVIGAAALFGAFHE